MISRDEVEAFAVQHGVPLPFVEKDYVMGWLLWGVAGNAELRRNLVLKGGNCLRNLYMPDTRFSDDLDFTAHRLDGNDIFRRQLESVCDAVSEASGIEFDATRLLVEEKKTPDRDCSALDGRVYFKGFAGDSSLTMRIKFDVSDYERIILPVQHHAILHEYSDGAVVGSVNVLSYSLEEVLAEKLRSWIQRTRSRDLFDAVKIIHSGRIPIIKRNILSAFLKKTLFKGLAVKGKEAMLIEEKFGHIEESWVKTIICPKNAFIVATNAIRLFKEFIETLFDPATLAGLGEPRAVVASPQLVRPSLREAIIQAGRARKLIRMRYDGHDRDIEPYSLKFKVRKSDGVGSEYFYGYDRTRGQTIKSFFVHEIQNISILPTTYQPREIVEF